MSTPRVTNAQAGIFPVRDIQLVERDTGMISTAWYSLLLTLYNRTGAQLGNASFESTQQTLAVTVSVEHRLPIKPKHWSAAIICTTDELGYVAGDEVDVTALNGATTCTTSIDDDEIFWSADTTAISIARKDTGAVATITPGNWALILRAGIVP